MKKSRCVRRILIITNTIRHWSPLSQSVCWEVQGLLSNTLMFWYCKLSFVSIIKLAHHCGGNHYLSSLVTNTMSHLGHGLYKVLLENLVKIVWWKILIFLTQKNYSERGISFCFLFRYVHKGVRGGEQNVSADTIAQTTFSSFDHLTVSLGVFLLAFRWTQSLCFLLWTG